MYSNSISRKGIENKSIMQILNKENGEKMILSIYYLTFRLHNGNNDISGVLIGPMFDGFIDSHDDLHVRYLTTYLGKQIYIDSAALTITNLKVQKCKEIAYCERDSFLLLDYGYFKHYEKDVFINFIKRAIVLNILVKNGNITNIEAFNADSIYLPVFIDEEESDE